MKRIAVLGMMMTAWFSTAWSQPEEAELLGRWFNEAFDAGPDHAGPFREGGYLLQGPSGQATDTVFTGKRG